MQGCLTVRGTSGTGVIRLNQKKEKIMVEPKKQFWGAKNIPAELVKRFKAQCQLEGVEYGPALTEALSDWIKKMNDGRG